MNRKHGRVEIRNPKRRIRWDRLLVMLLFAIVIFAGGVMVGYSIVDAIVEVEIVEVEPVEWNKEDTFQPLDVELDVQLQEYTHMLCDAYDVDFRLVMAVMKKESNYQTDAIGSGSDYGLMQINKINHSQLSQKIGVTDFLDAEQNIHAGVYMLSDLQHKYGEDNLVLMAYNMGENGARKLWNKGIYTSNYSKSVITIKEGLVEKV